jgi:hypothetical protein
MAHGYQDAFFKQNPETRAPQPLALVPRCEPVRFVPQKVRALKRAAMIAAGAAAATLAGLVTLD